MSQQQSQGKLDKFTSELDYVVFGIGVVVAALAVAAFILREEAASAAMWDVNDFLWTNLGWAYLLIMFTLVVFVFFLILGPWGNIRLGDEDEEPEFTFLSYFVMLYSAAIAAGIVFWGPTEGVVFFGDPFEQGIGYLGYPGEGEAAVAAMQYTFFHWGISAWTGYVVMALPIAYLAYRYDAPLRISTVIAPWVGLDNLDSVWAKIIDIVAVFATIGGVATTLGLVGSQFLVGLEYAYGIELGDMGTVITITGLTIAFTISVAAGIRKGIRRISYFNMALFALLMVVIFFIGPTRFIMTTGTEAVGNYINDFINMSLYTEASMAEPTGFVGGWTVFYWAWWFSWAPFVGLFIARISRGRTVRQVAFTGVFAATGVTIPWFATMGGTAIWMEANNVAPILQVYEEFGFDEAVVGFPMFEALPLGGVFMFLFLVLITTFFITSADSSTLALGMLTTGGAESPSTINRVIWGALIGLLASILMVVGGVDALQAAAIITGGPFALILLLAVVSMAVLFGKRRAIFLQEEESLPGTSVDFVQDDD
ncbi:Choline-glycine betaine transporter [Halalkaliarchaeum sp. AArc-CO]|uniref:BCCT family transporter n=1 Tax=unclassified Halalkaliarchaeum TaxID=2678344 RepID=UPI00217EDCC2|nr:MULTISPECIES: BCCT family transporter [unclassified Halalkaliarchaeum]MDR5672066.1 BCCT family transporter [Halalkaliarchaeum sp. AArc-GB]UWG51564.1 Choline-glycine betaine transporter [Halalkaliarchaeum sp. AArc-CO]